MQAGRPSSACWGGGSSWRAGGGQLSDGAVVAREYGLPAVAGIAGATQLLHDGQVVLLDGLSGTVTVIKQTDALSRDHL